MRIIISTSDKYLHIIPIFLHLYRKVWDAPCTIVGYKKPEVELPEHIDFYSMGEQVGDAHNFSGDMRKFFNAQHEYFIWMMEDTFIKAVHEPILNTIERLCYSYLNIGRVSLSSDSIRHYQNSFEYEGLPFMKTPADSDYRLSLQPAVWNRDYLLKYLTDGMTPWEFENQRGTLMQKPDHDFLNIALDSPHAPIIHNEGVRKRDIFKYDFTGIPDEVINEMKEKGIL